MTSTEGSTYRNEFLQRFERVFFHPRFGRDTEIVASEHGMAAGWAKPETPHEIERVEMGFAFVHEVAHEGIFPIEPANTSWLASGDATAR